MATIKDVAHRAGVGVSTASRVIRNKGYASEEVRKRVEQAVAELEYLPNLLARSMRGEPTKTIGLLIYDIVNPFFANLATGVEDMAHTHGFNVVICSSHPWNSREREKSYMQMLIERKIDGLVLQHVFSSEEYASLLERRNLPAVRILNPQPGYPYDLVRCDTRQGTIDLIRHLIGLGHQRIAALGPPMPSFQGADRLAGYQEALQSAGVEVDRSLILLEGWRTRDGYNMTHRLLKETRPDAIFAFGPRIAAGAACALREAQVRVPEEVALVCVDDFGLGSELHPFMTVVRQPEHEMGQQVTQLLIDRILGTYIGPPREVVLPAQLVVRQSCGSKRKESEQAQSQPQENSHERRWDDD